MDISLKFHGPYTFTDSPMSVFSCGYAKSEGIYLWTVRQSGTQHHLIHYVGETIGLAKRQREHLTAILGLNYGIWDPEKARNGVSELIWKGAWRIKDGSGPGQQIETYGKLDRKIVLEYVASMGIFFAKLAEDRNTRMHVEGCIGWNLRNWHPEYKIL